MHSIIIAIIILISQRYWLSIPACFFQGSLDIEKKWCNYLSNCSSGNPSPSLFLHSPKLISLQRRAQHPPRKREVLELRWLGLGKLSSLVPLDVQRSGLFVVSTQAPEAAFRSSCQESQLYPAICPLDISVVSDNLSSFLSLCDRMRRVF